MTTRSLLLSSALFPPLVTLLSNSEFYTSTPRQRNPWLGALANDENVRYTRSILAFVSFQGDYIKLTE